MKNVLLYCNSNAQAARNKQGWIGGYNLTPRQCVIIRRSGANKCVTTVEMAFALSFETVDEAKKFVNQYELTVGIFERKDI